MNWLDIMLVNCILLTAMIYTNRILRGKAFWKENHYPIILYFSFFIKGLSWSFLWSCHLIWQERYMSLRLAYMGMYILSHTILSSHLCWEFLGMGKGWFLIILHVITKLLSGNRSGAFIQSMPYGQLRYWRFILSLLLSLSRNTKIFI